MSTQVLPRYVKPLVLEALADTRVVFIAGARQAGKSTLAHEIAGMRLYDGRAVTELSLDDRYTREAALADPDGLIAPLQGRVVIDEVQRAPDLLLAIKAAVDRDPAPGRFLLTGSANVVTARKVKDALTGRMETVRLWPLSQSEIRGSRANFVDALFDAHPPAVANACQRPSSSPHGRPSVLPGGGHVFSPLVATGSPRWSGVFGGRVQLFSGFTPSPAVACVSR